MKNYIDNRSSFLVKDIDGMSYSCSLFVEKLFLGINKCESDLYDVEVEK